MDSATAMSISVTRNFQLVMDHQVLRWLISSTLTKGRLAPYGSLFLEFHFTFGYRKWVRNQMADAMFQSYFSQDGGVASDKSATKVWWWGCQELNKEGVLRG